MDAVMSIEICRVTFVKVGPFELEIFSFLADQLVFGHMQARQVS